MQKFDVVIALEGIAEARREWKTARTTFDGQVNLLMGRLLHEAARNYMSAKEVAVASGLTTLHVRKLMRLVGLDPKTGKRLLSEQAAKALRENAELMGIEPSQMDLTSPLAYLPMGEEMRKELQAKRLSKVIPCKDCGLPLTAEEDGTHECEFPETERHYDWCKGTCGGSCGRSFQNLAREEYVIPLDFDALAERFQKLKRGGVVIDYPELGEDNLPEEIRVRACSQGEHSEFGLTKRDLSVVLGVDL